MFIVSIKRIHETKMSKPSYLLTILMLFFNQASFALDAKQQAIVNKVNNNSKSEINFIRDTVNVNSSTFNKSGVRIVSHLYEKELKKLGFKTEWIPLPDSMDRAGHLFAYNNVKNGKKVLLIGHLDTVFPKDSPFQKFTQEGNIAKGPGVIDMKGGNAIILYALKALKDQGSLNNLQITIALMGDEESPGLPKKLSRKKLMEESKNSDIALAFESANNLNEVVTARRGLAIWNLDVSAKQGHSSLISTKEFGEGAILGIAEILDKIQNETKKERYLSFNPGIIAGGVNIKENEDKTNLQASGRFNVIPKDAKSLGDIRYLSRNNLNAFITKCELIAKNFNPPIQANFTVKEENIYPPMELSNSNIELMKQLEKVNKDLGFGKLTAVDPRDKGAADIAYIDPKIPALDGLGGVGQFDHSTDEYMEIDQTIKATQRLALFLLMVSKEK